MLGQSITVPAPIHATVSQRWPWKRPPGPFNWPLPSQVPRVSVVIPSYNQGRYIERTIRSILLQGYPNLEVLVLDGGSSDETTNVLRYYKPWLAYVSMGKDAGQADAIKKGLRLATGDVLAYLNSDDLYLPGAMHLAVAELARPEAAMVYGDRAIIDTEDRQIGTERYASFVRWQLRVTCSIPQETSFWRRDAYFRAGEVDADLHYAMDEDLWWRLSLQGKIVHIPRLTAAWRTHAESKSVKATAASEWQKRAQQEVRMVKMRYANPLPGPYGRRAIYAAFAARRRMLVALRGLGALNQKQ